MINIKNMAYSQIVEFNPICQESDEIRAQYFLSLKKYIINGHWLKRKNVKSQIDLYKKVYKVSCSYIRARKLDIGDYKYFLIFDLFTLLSYEKKILETDQMKNVKKQLISDIYHLPQDQIFLENAYDSVLGNKKIRSYFDKHAVMKQHKKFITAVWANVDFLHHRPYQVLVTATMSAGKSTFINTLVGKNVSLAQNMACTSKSHIIVSKPYDDGYSYEYDHEFVLDARKEALLADNNENASDKITVSTYFEGALGGKRIIIKDSPGVNFSGDSDHKRIAESMIKNRKDYDLLIYILNATQLGTEDDEAHLDFVKQYIGKTPILFVVNKIDAIDSQEESVEKIVNGHHRYLKEKGFENPNIFPISSRAGLLAKKQTVEPLLRYENRELGSLIDKFEEMDLVKLYSRAHPKLKVDDYSSEELQLLKTSGVRYVEEIIKAFYDGGKK